MGAPLPETPADVLAIEAGQRRPEGLRLTSGVLGRKIGK
jgi:hypothetical protein